MSQNSCHDRALVISESLLHAVQLRIQRVRYVPFPHDAVGPRAHEVSSPRVLHNHLHPVRVPMDDADACQRVEAPDGEALVVRHGDDFTCRRHDLHRMLVAHHLQILRLRQEVRQVGPGSRIEHEGAGRPFDSHPQGLGRRDVAHGFHRLLQLDRVQRRELSMRGKRVVAPGLDAHVVATGNERVALVVVCCARDRSLVALCLCSVATCSHDHKLVLDVEVECADDTVVPAGEDPP
mmetsp:Transcript_20466/g.46405  ORF Transcript_20466/g.46405 Transcript_20466/m.46405 type:complete len:236 (+) Transcript_20466:1828-2535(+)